MREVAKTTLHQRILGSLVVYHDGPRPYLRFVPVETSTFRHGLSLNVALPETFETNSREKVERIRETVAEYLEQCILSLTHRDT